MAENSAQQQLLAEFLKEMHAAPIFGHGTDDADEHGTALKYVSLTWQPGTPGSKEKHVLWLQPEIRDGKAVIMLRREKRN